MKALVVVDSRFGNTEELARIIGDALVDNYVVEIVKAPAPLPAGEFDLVVVGGPTEGHGISVNLRRSLGGISRPDLKGAKAAVFDTRFRMPRFLTGSAASGAASRLRKAGCQLVVEPESFFVQRSKAPEGEPQRDAILLDGEKERAEQWALALLQRLALSHEAQRV
jgi:flavodoxin